MDLRQVYDTLAEMPVQVGGQTAKVYSLDQLRNTLDSFQLPCRLLLPLGTPTEGRGFGFLGLGTTLQGTWQVVDLFLYKSVNSGLGLAEFADMLVDYCGNYATAIKGKRSLGGQTWLQEVNITPGTFQWPAGTDKLYVGVEVILQVGEIDSGS